MLNVLKSMICDNWSRRRQLCRLAFFDLRKQTSDTFLSWLWLVIQPAAYIFCFWFALYIGLRTRTVTYAGEEIPFVLWLSAGCVPWFFMKSVLGAGSSVFNRYSYLVSKVPFPMTAIPSIFYLSGMMVQVPLQILLIGFFALNGWYPTIYLLQIVPLLIITYFFWYFVGIMFSTLSALSKDFKKFLGIISIPLFWLSGVIFDLSNVSARIQTVLLFNPITFLVQSFRDAYIYQVWFWEDTLRLGIFACIFVAQVIVAVAVFAKFGKGVSDVL